jgi:phage terminase small subunit
LKGRKPKPASIRALHASRTRPHHRDRLPDDDEPDRDEHVAEPVAAPVGLTKAERVYWSWFAPLLIGAKVMTPADVETLADYCRACVAIDEFGRRRRTALRKRDLDQSLVRLLDASLRGWIERKTKLAGELGLTAIARTRVAWSGHAPLLDPVKKPTSNLAKLQAEAAELRRPVGVK